MKRKSKKQFQHGIKETVPSWNQNWLFPLRFPYWEGSPKMAWGIRQGDHFLPHKFIKRSIECWATSTKQLLNAGREHRAPRKPALSLRKEVGQNIKDIKRDKRVKECRPIPGRELWRRRSFQTPEHLLTSRSVWSFGNSEDNITTKGENNNNNNPQNTHLTTTPSGEIAQMFRQPTESRSWTGRRGLHARDKDRAWMPCGQ